MASIDFAAEVVELRRRFHEHKRRVSAGERSAELRAAIRWDADVLAVCMEEGRDDGSWAKLHNEMVALIGRLSH